jgi:hypothetical protein
LKCFHSPDNQLNLSPETIPFAFDSAVELKTSNQALKFRAWRTGMVSRALSLAAATLIGCLVATAVRAQNLDAGKSPSQIFSNNCSACHKSARGLLKTVAPSALPGFLRQHYTTGSEMAQMLSGFLMSNGATAAEGRGANTRGKPDAGTNLRPDAPIGIAAPDADQAKEQAPRPEHKPPRATAIPPDADGQQAGEASAPTGRRSRQPKPGRLEEAEPPAAAPGDQSGSKAARLAKKNRKGEPPKAEPGVAAQPVPEIAAKPETKPDTAPQPAPARNIDAGVPVPEPVNLPPPTAADIKPETPAVPAVKPVTEMTKPAASMPTTTALPPTTSTAGPAGGLPEPPISR